MGDDATQCEWCEHPEPPIYREIHDNCFVTLTFVGAMSCGVFVDHEDWLTALAPSTASAQLMIDDYLARMKNKMDNPPTATNDVIPLIRVIDLIMTNSMHVTTHGDNWWRQWAITPTDLIALIEKEIK